LLYKLAGQLASISVKVILVYISEAHTVLWPIGLDHPLPQVSFEDRVSRLRGYLDSACAPAPCAHFTFCLDQYTPPGDYSTTTYENRMHAWPDQFVIINREKVIVEENVFGSGKMDAVVLNDYADSIAAMLAAANSGVGAGSAAAVDASPVAVAATCTAVGADTQ